jgi:hypothetical protein
MAAELRMDRRQILKGAGAFGVGTLAALAPATVLADEDRARGLVGTWHAPHTTETGPFAGPATDGYITFGSGGVLIANDRDGPASGLGNWAKQNDDRFRFTFHTFIFDPNAPPGSKAIVRAQGTLNEESIRGRFSFTVVGPDGNPIPGLIGTGSFRGTRVPIEAV